MSERIRSGLLVGALLLAACAGPEERPSFILILADDQGWQGTSVQMDVSRRDSRSEYLETPNLERLAEAGMRFSDAYAPAPRCTPSRRSIQLGRTPARLHGTRPRGRLNVDDVRSIPQVLTSIDPAYTSAHFGKWGGGMGASPSRLGYTESDGTTTNSTGGFSSGLGRWVKHEAVADPKRMFAITERAIDFMRRQVRAGRPFYLQISHYAVHANLQAREETLAKYRAKRPRGVYTIPAFAAMTEDLDSAVGRVLDAVDELGVGATTWVFYTSDNGAVSHIPPHAAGEAGRASRNHPLRRGKFGLYEGGIRVPLIVRGPGLSPGTSCDVPVAAWDLLPTLAELAGGDPLQDEIDGVSLAPLLQGGCDRGVERHGGLVFHSPFSAQPQSAIRVDDHKLVLLWPDTRQLFNLREDVGEAYDLSETLPERAAELEGLLMAYLEQADAELPPRGGVR